MKIKDRTFVISGGASGLGLATARSILSAGGAVAILDVNESSWNEVASTLNKEKTCFYPTDVTKTESIADAVGNIVTWSHKHNKPLGGVIAAAGIGSAGRIINRKNEPMSIDIFDKTIAINLRGTVDLVRQILPHLVQNEPLSPDGERGVVINIASIAAYDGQIGQIAYAASKGAIASLALPLARDLAEFGVRAMTIAPGPFESGMTAMMSDKVNKGLEKAMGFPKRFGKPEEFASLVQECIENSMLNGTVIRMDGALRMPSKL